jgi:hypothetical protein
MGEKGFKNVDTVVCSVRERRRSRSRAEREERVRVAAAGPGGLGGVPALDGCAMGKHGFALLGDFIWAVMARIRVLATARQSGAGGWGLRRLGRAMRLRCRGTTQYIC